MLNALEDIFHSEWRERRDRREDVRRPEVSQAQGLPVSTVRQLRHGGSTVLPYTAHIRLLSANNIFSCVC
jgi:hypothetical protein